MKKYIVFFLKRSHCIAVLHISNVWFVVLCAISKSCVSRDINMVANCSHSDKSLKIKNKVLQEPQSVTKYCDTTPFFLKKCAYSPQIPAIQCWEWKLLGIADSCLVDLAGIIIWNWGSGLVPQFLWVIVDKGTLQKDLAEKYYIPKNTITKWNENRSKF